MILKSRAVYMVCYMSEEKKPEGMHPPSLDGQRLEIVTLEFN
jgi:hypothetical protein